MLVRSAGSTLASTFFLHLTTRLGRLFFLKLIETIFCKLLLWFVIDFTITSLNGVKTHMHATRTNSYTYTEFHRKRYISIRSSIGKTLGCWDSGWFNAGLDIFPSLENPYWTALLFPFQLLIVFSSKSETDSPSQENQQLKQEKQNTVDELWLDGKQSLRLLFGK